jgi:hypothetical protein
VRIGLREPEQVLANSIPLGDGEHEARVYRSGAPAGCRG